MTLSRLITLLSGIGAPAVRALPPVERLRLAHECLRLLQACDIAPPRQPPGGVLAELREEPRQG
jgi:hypothetical protein